LFYNSILRSILMMYLKIAVSAWLSLVAFKIDSRDDMINSWVAITLAGFITGFPLFVYYHLHVNRAKL
jgi:NhaP-type Na+/H+ and K+/H+ antiporter